MERFGFDSIRITGGEPTVRAHLPVLVQRLAALGVDLAMTTNGATLTHQAADLAGAGLRRINISCDSLRPDRFAAITGRDALAQVLAGIDAALVAGLDPVKINCVVVRGINDDEILDFAAFGRAKGVEVRFIEWMPLDGGGQWSRDQVVPAGEIIAAIDAVWPLVAPEGGSVRRLSPGRVLPLRRRGRPGGRDRQRDPAVLRILRPDPADRGGQLRNCLFSVRETDLRAILRSGGSDDDLAAAIEAEVGRKWAGHSIGQVHFIRPARSMSQIGG